MSSVQHLNTKAGASPYKGLFSTVSIVPPNTTIAYISTQWAQDPETGELVKGAENDYGKQSKIVWENCIAILKELGADIKDVVQRTVSYQEFNDDIGKVVVKNMVAIMPNEWKANMLLPSLQFRGVSHFHKPGIVYTVELIVALPNRK